MEQKVCINFCVKNGIKCSKTLEMLTVAYGESTLSKKMFMKLGSITSLLKRKNNQNSGLRRVNLLKKAKTVLSAGKMLQKKRPRGKRGGWRVHLKRLQRELLAGGTFEPSKHWTEDSGGLERVTTIASIPPGSLKDSESPLDKANNGKSATSAPLPPRLEPPWSRPYVAPAPFPVLPDLSESVDRETCEMKPTDASSKLSILFCRKSTEG
ncbi:hypothetical protein ALC57_05715 [Trachymyrmex cornetzi]|uniref:Mos1 transposase HTH domain-containing protein n=1 Tax=Trachymyrmex cornetzi TaxID=471704 RepID=A0A151JAI1_9HYME|nr:hypothetical protein ALC57_05715 [Trachymyrmex cornetzi]